MRLWAKMPQNKRWFVIAHCIFIMQLRTVFFDYINKLMYNRNDMIL